MFFDGTDAIAHITFITCWKNRKKLVKTLEHKGKISR